MKTVDFSGYFVVYNFLIGVLMMLASEKLGAYAGRISPGHRERVGRLARLSSLTFGSTVAALSAFIYVVFQIFRIGV